MPAHERDRLAAPEADPQQRSLNQRSSPSRTSANTPRPRHGVIAEVASTPKMQARGMRETLPRSSTLLVGLDVRGY